MVQKAKHPLMIYINPPTESEVYAHLNQALGFAAKALNWEWLEDDTVSQAEHKLAETSPPTPAVVKNSEEETLHVQADVGSEERLGLREFLTRIRDGTHAHKDLVVPNILDVVESPADDIPPLQEIVKEHCVSLHLIDQGWSIHPGAERIDVHLRAMYVGELGNKQSNGSDDRPSRIYTGGRPPKGFEVVSGVMVPDETYDAISETLQAVEAGYISKSEAAKRIPMSRTTIRKAIEERGHLYGVETSAAT